jgi:hypothetical protein
MNDIYGNEFEWTGIGNMYRMIQKPTTDDEFSPTYTIEFESNGKTTILTGMTISAIDRNDKPVHRHDWQLRVINYRVMAECACGETMDEDEIRGALGTTYD